MPHIYMIVCTSSGDRYIGATTIEPRLRFASHRSSLKGGYAPPLLQAAWDRYGPDQFRFVVLHECSRDLLRVREREAIVTLRPSLNAIIPHDTMLADQAGVKPGTIRYRRKVGNTLTAPKGKRVEVRGEVLLLRDIANRYNIPLKTVRERAARGQIGERLIRPVRKG